MTEVPPEAAVAPPRPTGTVTFLFTDIEGSTRLWETRPDAMRAALTTHDALFYRTIAAHGGFVFKTVGDAFCAAFDSPVAALETAVAAQAALARETWPEGFEPLRVRMSVHSGVVQETGGDYFGPPVNRVARLLSLAYGGQVLVSRAAQELVRDGLPDGVGLRDLGSHRLKDLIRPERVFQATHPALPADFPPLRSLDYLPNNLPVQLTSFVGRERGIARGTELLAATRRLTLTGSGGCGKTRLALQIGAGLLEQFPDGVYLVELAPLADGALIARTVANALNVREEGGRPLEETLKDALAEKHLLLILDNCEHLIAEAAAWASRTLAACPRLTLLATSREPLAVPGETVYRVPSLSLPPQPAAGAADVGPAPTPDSLSQFEAVRLFVERAVAAKPDFAVTNQNAPHVAELCWRLDGIPLAIELAAVRVRALSVEQIDARLHDRFRLLTGGNRSALPRQQTLRALIDWSYDLLGDAEKTLLCRLSVFAGGWTLESAEAVCGYDPLEEWDVVDLLTSLVEKSLAQADAEAASGAGPGAVAPRYRLLETVRQYAAENLEASGAADVVQGRHRDHFLRRVEEVRLTGTAVRGGDDWAWMPAEEDNFRGAIAFSLRDQESPGTVLRLVNALTEWWHISGRAQEGRQHLTSALEFARGERGTAAWTEAYRNLGFVRTTLGDDEETPKIAAECLAYSRQAGDEEGVAQALHLLGVLAGFQGRFAEGIAPLEEAAAINHRLGLPFWEARSVHALGYSVGRVGDRARGSALMGRAVELFADLGETCGERGPVLDCQGEFAFEDGDLDAAARYWREALVINHRHDRPNELAFQFVGLAAVAARRAQWESAARLHGAARAVLERHRIPMPPYKAPFADAEKAAVRDALGEEAFARCFAEGEAMDTESAVRYALDRETETTPVQSP